MIQLMPGRANHRAEMVSLMSLLEDLQKIIDDRNRVSTSPSELYCYSLDASQIEGMPDVVVRPLSTGEVSKILKLAYHQRVSVTARGAGTGLAGGAVPLKGGIVLDMSAMNRVTEVDVANLQAEVEPGLVRDDFNEALKPYGFFFPPDPGSSAMCTIGGMIANNASGMRCVKYGTTRAYVLDLEVVLADGTVINTGSRVLKSSAGYDLTRLMTGSEGTLGVITRAKLKIAPLPKARRLILTAFSSAEEAGRAVVRVLSSGIAPSACEILDRTTISVLKQCDKRLVLPDGDVVLFEVDGTEASTEEEVKGIAEACSPTAISITMAQSQMAMEDMWAARKLVGASISRLQPEKSRVYVGEDVGVPIKRIPEIIEKVQEISDDVGLPVMKFGHVGDGNLHVALFIDVTKRDQRDKLMEAADRIHVAALDLGGTVASEHGIGKARAQYMRRQHGPALDVMRAIKRALDPIGILNPGKLDLESE